MKLKADWVLLVDDDEIHNFIHQKILKKYIQEDHIEVAYNGKQAILLLEGKIKQETHLQNGIIFLDINMPVMNGFQFIEAFKKQYVELFPNTRILPLSSSDHMDDIIQMNALGVEGYLVKPLTYELAEELFL